MIDTPKATMSEAKCEVCGRPKWNGGHALNERECDETDGEVCRLHQAVTRANERIREAKHLISVRMEGFPCADLDDCENLKALQAISAALEGKET